MQSFGNKKILMENVFIDTWEMDLRGCASAWGCFILYIAVFYFRENITYLISSTFGFDVLLLPRTNLVRVSNTKDVID